MDYTQLQTWINEDKSLRDICEVSGKSYSNVRHWLKKYELKTNHATIPENHYNKEEVETSVKSSFCYSDVFRNMNMKVNGGSYAWLKKLIARHGIDTSHFQKSQGNNINQRVYEYTDDISNGERINTSTIQRFLKFHKVEEKCSNCGIDEWLGTPLRLDIDHKDGNCINNKLENLNYLCPNCHRQKTIKYDGIGVVRIGHEYKTTEKTKKCQCGTLIRDESIRCSPCASIERIGKTSKIIWPLPEDLKLMLQIKSMVAVGKELGVSDNAIRKHCKLNSIEFPTRKNGGRVGN